MKTIVIGATGATGLDLVKQLTENSHFSEILVFVRRDFPLKHPKITPHIIHFDTPESWEHLVQGDVLFSTMGTTLSQSGSKANQWKIDYDIPLQFGKMARKNGVRQQILVSSAMASPNDSFFYPQMKGKLEESTQSQGFERLVIFRPPSLIRPKTTRFGEKIWVKVLHFFNSFGFLKTMKPMTTEFLAQKMIKASLETKRVFLSKKPKIFGKCSPYFFIQKAENKIKITYLLPKTLLKFYILAKFFFTLYFFILV